MNRRDQIQEKVEQAMSSLDNVQRATANPFLYTRIQAVLEKEEKGFWASFGSFITKPAVAFATLVLILSMNSLVLFSNSDPTVSASSNEEEQLFAGEYTLATTTDEITLVSNEEQP